MSLFVRYAIVAKLGVGKWVSYYDDLPIESANRFIRHFDKGFEAKIIRQDAVEATLALLNK